MHSTIMGQPGGLRYRHTNLENRIYSPGENYFIYLRKNEKMLGSVGFCGKAAETNGFTHDAWLIRYFSIKAPMKRDPKNRKEASGPKEMKRSSVLRRLIRPVFENPSQLRGDAKKSEPAIIYGIIEQKNLRSMNFSDQMGFETIGTLASFTFSRMQPRKSGRMEHLPGNEQDSMLKLLKGFYSNYTLFSPNPLFKENDYYVIRESGRVVAGIQIYHLTWRIVDFGSKLTNRIVSFLAWVPWVKKRINPDEVRLLALDGIYFEKGHESDLYELMEGVLEKTGTYVSMVMVDKVSELYGLFKSKQKLGILHKILGTFFADIRVRFIHVPSEIRQYFIDHPTYIPTYDNS